MLNASADSITESKARQIAANFIAGRSSSTRASVGESLSLAKQSEGYYVFNRANSKGFVVVAANDIVGEPILGYADNGTLEADDMPDNMKGWLADYEREIAYLENHPEVQAATRAEESNRQAIAPIVKSLWTQEAPYNTKCPKSGKQTCYVGCTATAVAMVMRHHKWPERGQGSYSYDWRIGGTMTTVSADFSQSEYNWDIMEDRYAVDATGESADAVALLSYDVGVASHMQYSASGSGAYLYDAGQGLLKYFDYDKSLQLVNRDYYSHDEWQDLIYGELASNRPVVYSGYASNWSGHTFVVDGYNDGYYHFNWGWSGQYNGYFRLSALYPYGYGTNGTNYQYNYRQEALVGIQKNIGTAYGVPSLQCSSITTRTNTATFSDKVEFNGSLTYVGLYSRKLQFGVEITSTATGEKTYILGESTDVETNDRVQLDDVDMSSFPQAEGTYQVRPIAYDPEAGEYYEVRMSSSSSQSGWGYVLATVSGETVTFAMPEGASSATLSCSDLSLPSTLRAGMNFLAKATLSATGADYYGDVALAFYPEGSTSRSAKTNASVVDVAEGGSYNVNFVGTTPSPGTYVLRMIDNRGNILCGDTTVVVGDSITSKLAMKARSFTMANTTDVDPSNIEMELGVGCTGGSYCNNFFIHFYETDDMSAEYLTLNSDIVSMAEGDELTLKISGSVDGMKPSTKYTAYVLYNTGSWAYLQPFNLSSVTFTTAASSAISSVNVDSADSDIIIYNMSGKQVSRQRAAAPSLASLPKGVYIVKTHGGTKKIVK